jgi:enoyl-CoA hydratase/carnithine racemase
LRIEQDGRILTVRVDAPPFNFMTAQMQCNLDALTRAVDADATLGAVVVTGGVPGRYITHFDVAEILAAAQRNRAPERAPRAGMRAVEAMTSVPHPAGTTGSGRHPVHVSDAT